MWKTCANFDKKNISSELNLGGVLAVLEWEEKISPNSGWNEIFVGSSERVKIKRCWVCISWNAT